MSEMEVVWLVVAAVAGVAEAVAPGLITVWFVVGALAAFLVCHFGGVLALQILVFLAVSLLCLILLRPLILKSRKKGETLGSTLLGQSATVIEAGGTRAKLARVRTPDNMEWAALSEDGSALVPGQSVLVCGQESVKLIVRPQIGGNSSGL